MQCKVIRPKLVCTTTLYHIWMSQRKYFRKSFAKRSVTKKSTTTALCFRRFALWEIFSSFFHLCACTGLTILFAYVCMHCICLCPFQSECPRVTNVDVLRLKQCPFSRLPSWRHTEFCPPTMKQRDRITLSTCINTHIHKLTSNRACERPGSDRVLGSRERGLDGKRHSFTCSYFQISVMAGLFWLLNLLEFAPGSLTNGDRPGADLRSPPWGKESEKDWPSYYSGIKYYKWCVIFAHRKSLR